MKNNKKIIESQETGKTTFLYKKIVKLTSENKNLIILDSATDHADKSLLLRVARNMNNVKVFVPDTENLIVLNKMEIDEFTRNYKEYFPYNELMQNKNKIVCFDLSYFLEKGYDVYEQTNNIEDFKYNRNLYNYLSEQVALIIILMEKNNELNNLVVVMDEIEFPISQFNISNLQKNVQFLAAVHPENAFGTFYNSFEEQKFKKYVRRRGQ